MMNAKNFNISVQCKEVKLQSEVLAELQNSSTSLPLEVSVTKKEKRGMFESVYEVIVSMPMQTIILGTMTGVIANWVSKNISKTSPTTSSASVCIAITTNEGSTIIKAEGIDNESIQKAIHEAIHTVEKLSSRTDNFESDSSATKKKCN